MYNFFNMMNGIINNQNFKNIKKFMKLVDGKILFSMKNC